MTKKDLVNKLLNMAFSEEIMAEPTRRKVQKALRGGRWRKEILSGALIERLSEEERELLKTITSEDFNHRVEEVKGRVYE